MCVDDGEFDIGDQCTDGKHRVGRVVAEAEIAVEPQELVVPDQLPTGYGLYSYGLYSYGLYGYGL